MLKTQLKISSMHLCLDVWKCLIKVWWQEEVSLRVIWKGTPPVWFLWYLFDILCKQEKALIFAVLLCRWFMVSLLSAFNRFHHCTESAGWRPDPASGSPGRSIRCRMGKSCVDGPNPATTSCIYLCETLLNHGICYLSTRDFSQQLLLTPAKRLIQIPNQLYSSLSILPGKDFGHQWQIVLVVFWLWWCFAWRIFRLDTVLFLNITGTVYTCTKASMTIHP